MILDRPATAVVPKKRHDSAWMRVVVSTHSLVARLRTLRASSARRMAFALSKKLTNLEAAVAIHIANYNFCWRSREKDGPRAGHMRPAPAMQAGLTDKLWSFEDLYDSVLMQFERSE